MKEKALILEQNKIGEIEATHGPVPFEEAPAIKAALGNKALIIPYQKRWEEVAMSLKKGDYTPIRERVKFNGHQYMPVVYWDGTVVFIMTD